MIEEKKDKVWVGDDGIIYVGVFQSSSIFESEKDIEEVMDEIIEKLKDFSGKGRILINMSTGKVIRSHQFRKKTAEKVASIFKNPGFDKTALYGGNIVLKTIAKFIITASGKKGIQLFETKEEALKWLKKK